MARKLAGLQVNRVALVDRGANQHADVVLYKRDVEKAAMAMPGSPAAMMTHLDSAHGVSNAGQNPFGRHDAAHAAGTFSGPPHTHTAKRSFSADQRKAMAANGQALPDGSFPIENRSDLSNAIQALGRASNSAQAKAHIIKRAKALGATDMLPDDWNVAKADSFSSLTIKSEDGTDLTITPSDAIYMNEGVEKVGRKISNRRLAELKSSRDAIDRVIAEAETQDESSRKEARMSEDQTLSDETRNELSEEVRNYLTSVEEKLTKIAEERDQAVNKAAETKTEDEVQDEVLKGLPEAVQKRIEAVEKRAEEAERTATEERDKRENAEVAKRLETAKAAGVNPNEWAPKLRKVAESDPEFAAKIEETLNANAEAVRTGALFSEIGKSGGEFTSSEPEGKLDQMAEEIAKRDGISKPEAVVKALETEEGRALYAQHASSREVK